MTTACTIPNAAAEQLINHRLDVIDRALLDLLPRNERLALVAQVESRARELVAASAAPEAGLAGSTACPAAADAAQPVPGAWPISPPAAPAFLTSAAKRRSGLALTAGLLGIAALVLLFMTPVTYLIVGILGDVVGEIGAVALLGVHVGVVTLGGLAAVALAIAALVSLKRRRGLLVGHGWAIAALCTGPLPLLAGATTGLILGAQMLGASTTCVQTSYSDGCPSDSICTPLAPSSASYGEPHSLPADPLMSTPTDSGPRISPAPADLPPVRAAANEAPASQPEARPEPPGVP